MIAINGFGRMGKAVAASAMRQVMIVERDVLAWQQDDNIYRPTLWQLPQVPHVIIDFSHHTATMDLVSYATEYRVPTVVATTGHTEQEIALLRKLAQSVPVYHSGNLSAAMPAFIRSCLAVANSMVGCRIEVHEIHHAAKKDAPSGTAKMIAEALCRLPWVEGWRTDDVDGASWIHMGWERLGDTVGVHRVTMIGDGQQVVLEHTATDRRIFAEGALRVAERLVTKAPAMYDWESLDED